jgi:multiple antibiotic resistance protein
MLSLAEYTLLIFTSFLSLINPVSLSPVFLGLTRDLEPRQRRAIALRATAIAFGTLLFFALAGQLIFSVFSITVDSFRVVGGVIFFMMGYDMLQARMVRVKMDDPVETQENVKDITVTPLAIPLICGPGAITNAIVMWADAGTAAHKVAFVVAVLAIMSLVVLAFLGAARILPRLGETGNRVLLRLMGLIVMVIAVEFLVSGATPIVRRMLKIG